MLVFNSDSIFYLYKVDQSMQQFWDQQLPYNSHPDMQIYSPTLQFDKLETELQEFTEHMAAHSFPSLEAGTKSSLCNDKKRLAGQRSREKKKNYVKALEENVKLLSSEIQHYDLQISRYKDQLVQAYKTNHNTSNDNSFTFMELERNSKSEDPDIDRINLLIDLIKNRIGACGSERQANLCYNFKQIVNSMFPAIYRYLLNSADESIDIFTEGKTHEELTQSNTWTSDLYSSMKIEEWQIKKLFGLKQQFCKRREEAMSHVLRLKAAKMQIKKQGEIFERRMDTFREDIDPIQCAMMTLFAQKNKLRREFTICDEFQTLEKPKKMVKIQ